MTRPIAHLTMRKALLKDSWPLIDKAMRLKLKYCPEQGTFTALKPAGRFPAGRVVGVQDKRGRILIRLDGRTIKAHQLAFLWMTGSVPNMIDHIDGNPANNKWVNLRQTNHSLNNANRHVYPSRHGLKGVGLIHGKWVARIKVNGVTTALGSFKCPVMAVVSYDLAARAAFGDHAQPVWLFRKSTGPLVSPSHKGEVA